MCLQQNTAPHSLPLPCVYVAQASEEDADICEQDADIREQDSVIRRNLLPSQQSSPIHFSWTLGVGGSSPPAFRSWTWPSPDESSIGSEEPVPGLRELLRIVGLSSFREIVEAWCKNEGAAFLSYLTDEGVAASGCHCLKSALQHADDCSKNTAARVWSSSMMGHLQERDANEADVCHPRAWLEDQGAGSRPSIVGKRNPPCMGAGSYIGHVQKGYEASVGCQKQSQSQPMLAAQEKQLTGVQPLSDKRQEQMAPVCDSKLRATMIKRW